MKPNFGDILPLTNKTLYDKLDYFFICKSGNFAIKFFFDLTFHFLVFDMFPGKAQASDCLWNLLKEVGISPNSGNSNENQFNFPALPWEAPENFER